MHALRNMNRLGLNTSCFWGELPQKVVRTDAATHAVPAWKMSTQGKTGRKKKS